MVKDAHFRFVDDEDFKRWKAFKSYVMSEYGQIRGKLGKEVTKALDHYMDSLDGRKKEKVLAGKRNISFRRALKIHDNLPNGGPFPERTLYNSIEKVAGTSEKTIRKYRKLMLRHNLIGFPDQDEKEKHIGEYGGQTLYIRFPTPDWLEEIS